MPVSELFSTETDSDTVNKYSVLSLSHQRRNDVYRVDVMDVSASAGNGNSSRDFIEVISSIEYVTEEAKTLFGHRPANQVKLINVRGDSMQGTIEPGDLILLTLALTTLMVTVSTYLILAGTCTLNAYRKSRANCSFCLITPSTKSGKSPRKKWKCYMFVARCYLANLNKFDATPKPTQLILKEPYGSFCI